MSLVLPSTALSAISLAVLLGLAPSCDPGNNVAPGAIPGYELHKPDTLFYLARSLREVSGLTVSDTQLLAIQDEVGRLFTVSASTGKVVNESKFGSGGDYEAVEVIGSDVWIVQSDGDIYVRSLSSSKTAKRTKTELKAKHDIEGLAFHPADSVVLIAAKEHLTKARERVIFSLPATAPKEEPRIWARINIDSVAARLEVTKQESKRFKPSAIAVHPRSGETFVLSSALQAVVVLDENRALTHVARLDATLLPQPEGIAFMPNGDMYIASEDGRRGRLALFSYHD